MSFYGTSYHYTAESFARVILKNMGKMNYTFAPTSSDFQLAPNPDQDPVYLDAFYRDSGLGLQSGNYWIKLAYDGTTVQILHDKPADNGPKTVVEGLSIDKNPPQGAVPSENRLSFNQVLKIPVFTYDNTGHIIAAPATYYQMPPNPAITLEERMRAIDGLPSDPPGKQSLKTELTGRVDDIQEQMDIMGDTTNPNSLISKINKLNSDLGKELENIQGAVAAANTALTKAEEAASAVSTLQFAIRGMATALQNQGIDPGIKID